jgi:hypothetical protein
MSDQRGNNKINVRQTADFSCQVEPKKVRKQQIEEAYVRDQLEKLKLDSPKKSPSKK